jgi:hypothetical protein
VISAPNVASSGCRTQTFSASGVTGTKVGALFCRL